MRPRLLILLVAAIVPTLAPYVCAARCGAGPVVPAVRESCCMAPGGSACDDGGEAPAAPCCAACPADDVPLVPAPIPTPRPDLAFPVAILPAPSPPVDPAAEAARISLGAAPPWTRVIAGSIHALLCIWRN